MFGGLRWVLTQVLLKSTSFGLNGTIDTLYHVAPTMAMTLLPFALVAEGERITHSPMLFGGDADVAILTLLAILMGTVLAFFLTISEFLLVEYAGRYVRLCYTAWLWCHAFGLETYQTTRARFAASRSPSRGSSRNLSRCCLRRGPFGVMSSRLSTC